MPAKRKPIPAKPKFALEERPTIEMVSAYQRLYDFFNETLFEPVFGSKLPQPILNLAHTRANSLRAGHFSSNAWKDLKSGETLVEVNVVPQWIGEDDVRSLKEACATLVHEMVHLWDHFFGKPGSRGWHSNSWFDAMEALGLRGVKNRGSRYSVSTEIIPGGLFDRAYARLPKTYLFPFGSARPVSVNVGSSGTKMGKRDRYECPSCGLIAYAKFEANLSCGDCSHKMIGSAGL